MQLVLASKSAIRADLLRNVGLGFETTSAGVDEDAIKLAKLAAGASVKEVAVALAEAKALAAPAARDALVIGADQTLEFQGQLISKCASLAELRKSLLSMRGALHQLHSAAALAQGGEILWSSADTVSLTMRDFSDAFLDHYLHLGGETLLEGVGGYQFEGRGAQLFEATQGDYFTILGLPLLSLLSALRDQGAIAR